MRQFQGIILRGLLITIICGGIGLGVNTVWSTGLPWLYVPPTELAFADVKVPLVNEREAARFLNDPETVFVDTRSEEDYRERHVKSAVFLSPDNVEERFVAVQALIPEDRRLILYCYGPDCDMAEKVAQFLAPMGYKNMMIMTSGFREWEKAGYPVEGQSEKGKP